MTLKKNLSIVTLVLVAAMLVASIFAFKGSQQQPIQQPLSQDEVAKLVKPSVVRIISHITGHVTIPAFDFSTSDLTFSPIPGKTFKDEDVDEYYSGSGFAVNPDGYIMTNSHVVSLETLKNDYIEQIGEKVIDEKTKDLTDAQLLEIFKDRETAFDFQNRLVAFVKSRSTFKLTSTITVLNPTSQYESLKDLITFGFPATIISVNDNYWNDEKDVALIKINQHDLPAMAIGDSASVNVGDRIVVFGFPATAEFNSRNPLESTFTQGIISASKYSEGKDFSILQTDAKISEGSSGGPLLDNKGNAIGIITFQTGAGNRDAGDNFAFALPTQLITAVLDKNRITNQPGSYYQHFQQGLFLYHSGMCQEALKEFAAAAANSAFGADRVTKPYVEKCGQLVASGKSMDTAWQRDLSKLKSVNGFSWFVILGRLLLVAIGMWCITLLVKQMKQDEQEITAISESLAEEKRLAMSLLDELHKRGIILPLPDEETHAQQRIELDIPHPHLQEFVQEARSVGLKDEQIEEELKKVSWDPGEIAAALK